MANLAKIYSSYSGHYFQEENHPLNSSQLARILVFRKAYFAQYGGFQKFQYYSYKENGFSRYHQARPLFSKENTPQPIYLLLGLIVNWELREWSANPVAPFKVSYEPCNGSWKIEKVKGVANNPR